MTEEGDKFRRAYGRGYYDAMRKAGEQMNSARYLELERGITGVARKVLEHTPVAESWTPYKVGEEMRRCGIRVDIRTIAGALNTLAETGLLRESPRGQFIRIVPKEKVATLTVVKDDPALQPSAADTATNPEPDSPLQKDTMDKLAEMAEKMRAAAADLSKMAADIDAVAIEVEERIQRVSDNAGKLKQLQALLKDLGA